jgi:type IV pilus assembly protein PilA
MKNLQTIKHNAQKGFTLIELMIVVAIIGILAALAIPAYTDYTIKSRVAEGASLSGAAKTAVELYWSENGTLTESGASITSIDVDFFGAQGEYVSSVSVVTGPFIEIQLKTGTSKLGGAADGTNTGGADGGCFRYTPTRSAGQNITWDTDSTDCATNVLAPKYLPKT